MERKPAPIGITQFDQHAHWYQHGTNPVAVNYSDASLGIKPIAIGIAQFD